MRCDWRQPAGLRTIRGADAAQGRLGSKGGRDKMAAEPDTRARFAPLRRREAGRHVVK